MSRSSARSAPALPFDPDSVPDDVVLSHAQVALRGGVLDQSLACASIVAERSPVVETRCEALRLRSNALRLQGDWEGALESARKEGALAEEAGLADRRAEALNAESAVYLARGEFATAMPLLESALKVALAPRLLGVLWQNVGLLHASLQEFSQAEEALHRSRRYFDQAGDAWGSACTLINQGCVRLDQEDHEGATEVFASAIVAARAANDLDLVAGAMMNQARAFFRLGRFDEAEFHASSAAGFFISSKMSLRYAECLMVLGDVEHARGEVDIARRCWQRGLETAEALAAQGLREELLQRLQHDPDHRG